jgi:hypothetical protein
MCRMSGKVLEGSCPSPVAILPWNLPGVTKQKHNNFMKTITPVEIQFGESPSTNQRSYCLSQAALFDTCFKPSLRIRRLLKLMS